MSTYTYYLSGSADEYGNLQSRRETPFTVHRVALTQTVEFWEPNDQVWKRSVLGSRWQLVEDLLGSGAWVRELGRDEFARDVPNYDAAKFGAGQ